VLYTPFPDMNINYVTGDATKPVGNGNKIIVHICNDIGGWGAGFVLAISRRWKQPERCYRSLNGYKLGTIELVKVEEDTWVANMIAQHDVRYKGNLPPIRYPALENCLMAVAVEAKKLDASIHMPRIGCGLAGGTWAQVEQVISMTLADLPVTVYDLAR
jgi:O-acetyl-ADP-ribose deacetylase (regulator of RNase III)